MPIKLLYGILSRLELWLRCIKISSSILSDSLSLACLLIDDICLSRDYLLNLIGKVLIFIYLSDSTLELLILFFQFRLHFLNACFQDINFRFCILQLFEAFREPTPVAQ